MADLVFNIERVGFSKLKAQDMHDNRKGGNLEHTNQRLKMCNKVLKGTGNPKEDVQAVLDATGAQARADNETPFTRFVFSASPEHFDDLERSTKFVQDVMGFVEDEYGEGVAYASLHLDEKTPHIHVVCVPIYETKTGKKKVSHHQHKATKGLNSYERMRRRAAKATGLAYGVPGGKEKTEAQAEALRIVKEAEAQAAGIVQQAEARATMMLRLATEAARDADGHRAKARGREEQALSLCAELSRQSRRLGDEQAQKLAEAGRAYVQGQQAKDLGTLAKSVEKHPVPQTEHLPKKKHKTRTISQDER